MPLASAFGPNSISINYSAESFEAAVSLAVELLVQDGKALPGYTFEVLENLNQLGPYFVVAPGIAIAHAKPSASVIETGLALAVFSQGVQSGSTNDPVTLLFALAAADANSHLELLSEFAAWISTPGIVNSLQNASAESVIRRLL
ncbi:PTS sugar transporter subunit IIA [Aquiluna sp. KACHI24]|uniref:PTS sugar transporter subunit IIA n=1 Tax=Aquiluna sp. KACHI24 TaxID=2968831 RepID=UPI00220E9911|nr:PTS sugar transporter subunit IIA [Aquiluna sp. KACHI24]BDP99925.1 PTS ascorbate transporter subunit IIA [Aquiluna sp. KACHI24]